MDSTHPDVELDDAKFEARRDRAIQTDNDHYDLLDHRQTEREEEEIEQKGWNGPQDAISEGDTR